MPRIVALRVPRLAPMATCDHAAQLTDLYGHGRAVFAYMRVIQTQGSILAKPLVLVALVLGVVLLIVSAIYVLEPASSLPGFFPGYAAADAGHHYKHAIGALILALALFAFAWFQSKPRRAA